jgi:hypothetical protein
MQSSSEAGQESLGAGSGQLTVNGDGFVTRH